MNVDQSGSGAIVTGGASGLGAAVVRRLHATGWDVTIADIDEAAGQSLAEALGARARFIRCDVALEHDVEAAVDAASRVPLGLRAAVACAGIGVVEQILGDAGDVHSAGTFWRTLEVNLVGAFNILRFSARAMSANEAGADEERGSIVLISSLSGIEGAPGEIAYAASKGGIIAMALPAARELSGRGIRVNALAPGSFDTPMMGDLSDELKSGYGAAIPFPKRFGRPEEFAALVGHVIDNQMINGATYRIDGGARHH